MLIEVLGPVRLTTDGGVPVEVPERKLRLLLAALVAAGGEPVPADALIDRLWGESPPKDPRAVLRAKLSRLRSLLDTARPGARELLERTPAGYRLAVGPDAVDAGVFAASLSRARRLDDPARAADAVREALGMWRGEAYGDLRDEAWLAPVLSEAAQTHGDAVEHLVVTLVELGEPQEAVDEGMSAVPLHPTREHLVGALMRGLYQLGRQHEALELYESLRTHLADELGVDPGPDLRALHTEILRQDPSLSPAAVPEAAPEVTERTNLPAETVPLIGRVEELEELDRLVSASRLVTLTGIGGVGKTRLAQQFARARVPELDRGAWFLDLTELTPTSEGREDSAERIARTAAAAMGLSQRVEDVDAADPDGPVRQLGEALGARTALLVLDNCEHVVAEAAAFTAEILRRAPGARVLATSREPLGLPEEQQDHVPALGTTPREDGRPAEAVEFFVARATATDPGFTLDEAGADAVAELCRRLDGLPLALELAAARVRGLAVEDLLERLSDRLNLLRRPGRGVPRRQQTLRGMIDWSWSLLGTTEQAVLRRLAVHPGTVGLETAEALCADLLDTGAAMATANAEILDVLAGLVDRSMVTRVPSPAGTRYGLLESIAAYAGEKLEDAGERDGVVGRHLDHHLDLVRRADAGLRGPAQREWLGRMEAERTQVRHAVREAVRVRDGERAVALVLGMFRYCWMSGRQADLHGDLTAAIALPGPRGSAHAAATTLAAALALGDGGEEARARVSAALARFGEDAPARADVQWFAGMAHLAAGLHDGGERLIDEAVELLIRHGMDWEAVVAACQRDWVLVTDRGESPRGLPDGRDPGDVLRAIGDPGYGPALVLGVEYCVAEAEGDHERAADAARRALEICEDMGFRSEAAHWRIVGAISALRSGDLPSARRRLDEGRAVAEEIAYSPALDFADKVGSMIALREADEAGESGR